MWYVLHFIFMYFSLPSPFMYWYACIMFTLLSLFHEKKISVKDAVPCLCTIGMYVGFYLTKELYHWGYLPWWVTVLCGFRKQRGYIWFGGVLLGIIFYALSWRARFGHIIMNLSRMFKLTSSSMGGLAGVYLFLFILFGAMDGLENTRWYVDVLAGLSCLMSIIWKDHMSWFSIAMLFTNSLSPGLCILHLTNLRWYLYYKNNHYRKVKYTFYYVYPIMILLVLFVREEIVLASYMP